MLCAIDIDGTIAGRNMRQFARVCNESLSLGITLDQLPKKMLYTTFLRLPEVTAYQLRVGQQRFDRDIRWIDLDPQVLLAMVPLPGAVQGITQLVQYTTVSYYTVRYSSTQLHKNQAMASATQQWLTEKQFPQSCNIVFCTSIADKLNRLAGRIKAEAESIILIDDRYSRLLEELMRVDQCHVDLLRQHLQLVAFGAREVPERCHGFQVIPLPTWNDLSLYIDSLLVSGKQKEFLNHGYLSSSLNANTH
jgi:uncharacterized HAD superfamily protein